MWGGNYWGRTYWPAEYWGPVGGQYTASGCASPGGFATLPTFIRITPGGVGILPTQIRVSLGGIALLPTIKLASLGGFSSVTTNLENPSLGGVAIVDRDMC